ncbi:MAG: hypothetical protein JXR46_13785 [Calditrichaceae bacterium]|nr:hypothetical protein [Calditrichaceae bacterium]MBN2710107.1 hypothetical protein [Calditrichaceae bacterium]RQV93443.1 MAG: hypothetical protein EH224_12565 [Calditrichota bacterium]
MNIIYIRLAFVLMIMSIIINCSNTHSTDYNAFSKITGFWEGRFICGSNYTIMIHFYEQNNQKSGHMFLFQNSRQIQFNSLKNISLINDRLSFFIDSMNIPFEGDIDEKMQCLNGNFYFPGRKAEAVTVTRIRRPSIGNLTTSKGKYYHRNGSELKMYNSR